MHYRVTMLRQIPLRTAAAAPSRLLSTPIFRVSPFANTRFLTTETTTATSQTPTTLPPSSQQASSPAPTSLKPKATRTPPKPQPRQLSYLAERTNAGNLAVYCRKRAGGTKKLTVIRKITGNTQQFKQDIVEELGLPKAEVKINPITGHISIKGFHLEAVQNWLLARGF